MLAFLNFFTLLILGIAAAAVIIATPINLIFELDWFDSPINLILILLWSILLSGIFQICYGQFFFRAFFKCFIFICFTVILKMLNKKKSSLSKQNKKLINFLFNFIYVNQKHCGIYQLLQNKTYNRQNLRTKNLLFGLFFIFLPMWIRNVFITKKFKYYGRNYAF